MPLATTDRRRQDPGQGPSGAPASSAGPSAGENQREEGIGAGDLPGGIDPRGRWVPSTRLLVLCGLAVVTAAIPFAVYGSIGIGSIDAPIHLRNLQGFYRNLSFGHLVPTWIDTQNASFGAHVFHVRGRGEHYLFSLFMWLMGGDGPSGLRFGSLAALALGGLLTYRLARMFFPPRVSVLAALLHLTGPYLVFSTYAKYALCETVGLALAPWTIRRFLLLMERPSPRSLGWFALSYAVLIDTHLPVSMALGGLFTVVALFASVRHAEGRTFDVRRPAWAAGGAVLALSMTAYYWIFMFVGSQADLMDAVLADWSENYQWFLFSRNGWAIPTTAIPLVYIAVGLVALGVGCHGRFRAALPDRLRRFWPALWVSLAAALLLQTHASRWVWNHALLHQCFDRTHRLDAAVHLPVILMLIGSGWAVGCRSQAGRRQWYLRAAWAGTTAAYLGLAVVIPWYVFLSVRETVDSFPPPDLRGAERVEYTPSTASPALTLAREYTTTWKVKGEGVRDIKIHRWAPEDKRFSFESDATTVDLRQYHYAGWRLEIDGTQVDVRAGKPYGQLQFDVAAGVHDGWLQLVWPPACRYGSRVSIAALALTACMIIPRPKSLKRRAFL